MTNYNFLGKTVFGFQNILATLLLKLSSWKKNGNYLHVRYHK